MLLRLSFLLDTLQIKSNSRLQGCKEILLAWSLCICVKEHDHKHRHLIAWETHCWEHHSQEITQTMLLHCKLHFLKMEHTSFLNVEILWKLLVATPSILINWDGEMPPGIVCLLHQPQLSCRNDGDGSVTKNAENEKNNGDSFWWDSIENIYLSKKLISFSMKIKNNGHTMWVCGNLNFAAKVWTLPNRAYLIWVHIPTNVWIKVMYSM